MISIEKMADSLHSVVRQVRDTYLEGLTSTVNTLFATLESKIRDTLPAPSSTTVAIATPVVGNYVSKDEFHQLKELVENDVIPMLNGIVPQLNTLIPNFVNYKNDMASLKTMYGELASSLKEYKAKVDSSRNPIIQMGVVPTPSVEKKQIVEEDVEEEEVEVNELTGFEFNKKVYWRSNENDVFKKIDDESYEQVGTYDPKTKKVTFDEEVEVDVEAEKEVEVEEEEVEEEEEGEVEEEEEEVEAEEEGEVEEEEEELAEFEYKGKTYYRDTENIVYNENLEQVGFWTGSKLVVKKS